MADAEVDEEETELDELVADADADADSIATESIEADSGAAVAEETGPDASQTAETDGEPADD